ncbi:hypothetical protein V6N13_057334 [Hibiscus sabdariffa]
MSDSLVRVSRRVGWVARRPTPGARWCRSTPRRRVLGSTIEVTTSPRAYQRLGLGPPPRSASVHAPSRSADCLSPFHIRPGRIAGPHPLPSRQFQALFDSLFKVFSSFPRGTCSLSVSRSYLALDGIYRPIRAAFLNNPTRRQRLVVRQGPGTTGLSPSSAPLSRGLGPGPSLRTLLQTTIRTPRVTDSQAGLFPVRSPLLRESLFSGLLATTRAANCPGRRDPNTSPDHSIGRSDGRIYQVALLRDVRLAWSSTYYLGRGEAITRREHRSCRGTKCTSYERTGPRPYAQEIFRSRKHDRASMH